MTTRALRQIIRIDEAKCNGCGNCIDSCVEGALALVEGKARLVKEKYCDGLAACLKDCPQGALSIEEREAEAFDEEAAVFHAEAQAAAKGTACACPGTAVRRIDRESTSGEPGTPAASIDPGVSTAPVQSALTHWPVQLALIPPGAGFLEDADVLLTAHCAAVACPNLHRDFLGDHSILIACPKLDDAEAHLERLTEILKQSRIRSLTVLRMEVPCCSGLTRLARLALAQSGNSAPLRELIAGIKGDIKEGK